MYVTGAVTAVVSLLLRTAVSYLSFLFTFTALCGICVIAYAIILQCEKNERKGVRKAMFIIKIAALAATVLFIISFTVIQILIASGSESDGKSCDYIIVLGCGINGRSMSLTGKSRADTAIEYMNAHPDCTAIICGGQGKREVITEAEAFYNYMSDNGIDKARMIKEEHSTDTSQNIRFAKKILEDIGADVNNDSFTVVTNEFHLYRSKLIMQKNGFKKVSGLSAPTPNVPFLKVNLYLREYFSVVFEYLNL